MKTLDEVIKAYEYCQNGDWKVGCGDCVYKKVKHGACKCVRNDDALHYLREYQRYQNTPSRIGHMAMCDENEPLTWDELKGMEGKPVWVEVLSDEIDLSSRWMLVARETKAHSLPLAYTDDICHWFYVHEDKLGKAWQAYRKERG